VSKSSPYPRHLADARQMGFVSQSIQRALDVIEMLSRPAVAHGMTLTELAESLDLPKSTTVRLLANLEMRGFVEQDGLRRYRIGMRLFSIGGQALANSHLRTAARPYLEDLTSRIGESTYLGVLDMDQVLYVDRIESPQPVKSLSPIGSHRPLNATAVGKVLLAYLDRATARELLGRRGMAARTSRTTTELDELLRQLDEIAETGLAVDIGEWDDGLTCIAAPIFDRGGKVTAALGVSGPSWRLSEQRFDEVFRLLARNAAEVSRELGHRPGGAPEDGSETDDSETDSSETGEQ